MDDLIPKSEIPVLWPRLLQWFTEGDPRFVPLVRRVADAERLGGFAARWVSDQRPAARAFLKEYLFAGLNCIRHEALVKRLFKLAQTLGDDEVMGWLMVAFDRSIRQQVKIKERYDWRTQKLQRTETKTSLPPQLTIKDKYVDFYTTRMPHFLNRVRSSGGLFSFATRHYLRRRAWRYFRKLGRNHPERYAPAMVAALKHYRDADVASERNLLDCWGLLHALFHHAPVLIQNDSTWDLEEGRTVADLKIEPMFVRLWQKAAKELLGLLTEAQCRPVRKFAISMLRKHHQKALSQLPLDTVMGWLSAPDADLAVFAAGVLPGLKGIDAIPAARWLQLLDAAVPESQSVLAGLVGQYVSPHRISLEQAADYAGRRSVPLATLGLSWLQGKAPQDRAEVFALVRLRDAGAEAIRPEIVTWVMRTLGEMSGFDPMLVLEFFDCRHADVRQAAWEWFDTDARLRFSHAVVERLLETPYDDLRLKLLARLETDLGLKSVEALRLESFSPELVRFVWATILLNVVRGSRRKPAIVAALVARVTSHPGEAGELLPLLAVALRSSRGPEFRSGLAGLVRLGASRPDLGSLIAGRFPEYRPMASGEGSSTSV